MATINSKLAITSFSGTSLSALSQGGILEKKTDKKQWGTSDNISLYEDIVPQDGKIIDNIYTLFSFSVSRSFSELGFFSNPRITLVIQGKNQKGDLESVVAINKTTVNHHEGLSCKWDGYYGIIRAVVHFRYLQNFNQITAVGIVMTRENGEKVAAHIYTINAENTDWADSAKKQLNDQLCLMFDLEKIEQRSDIKEIYKLSGENLEKPEISVPENKWTSLWISPINRVDTERLYDLYGAFMNDSNRIFPYHKNKIYYSNAFSLEFKSIGYNQSWFLPSQIGFDSTNNQIQWNSCVNGQITERLDTDKIYKPDFKYLVYGGYKYKLNDDYEHSTLLPQSQWGKWDWSDQSIDEDVIKNENFFKYFVFSGERYRTKFYEYGEKSADDKFSDTCSVTLYKHYVDGYLQQKNISDSPYQLFYVPQPITQIGETISIKKGEKSSEDFAEITKYHTSSIRVLDRFTNSVNTTINIRIPLEDEYQYYLLGDVIGLQKEDSDEVNDKSEIQEIVKYYDMNIVNNFESESDKPQLVRVTDGGIFELSTYPSKTNTETSTYSMKWLYKISNIPLSLTSLTLSDFSSDVSEELKKVKGSSYFEYRLPQIFCDNKNITEQTKFYQNFDYYRILNCREYPSEKEVFSVLEIRDKKLYYQFKTAGIGDYNDSFSINQFINYAMDGEHPIGLSFFDKQKRLDIYRVSDEGEQYLFSVGTDEKNEQLKDSGKTLKLFYTDVLLSFDLPNSDALESLLKESEIHLKMKYYDNTQKASKEDEPEQYNKGEYIIFEMDLGNVSVIAGSRPLGLRKNGIIINPTTSNEALDNSAERINFKTNPDNNGDMSGVVMQLVAHNDKYQKLQDPEGKDIVCEIEYRGEKIKDETGAEKYTKNFYFNGVDPSELKQTVETNSEAIKTLSDALSKKIEYFTYTYTSDASQLYSKGCGETVSVEIKDDRFTSQSICIPIPSIIGVSGETRGRAQCEISNISPTDGTCNITYRTGSPDTSFESSYTWQVQIILVVINFPTLS